MDQVPQSAGQRGEQEHTLVVALLYVCFQLLLDIMQELIFLLREIKAIETRKRQGGQKKGSVMVKLSLICFWT